MLWVSGGLAAVSHWIGEKIVAAMETPVVDEAALAKAWAFSEFKAMRRLMNSVPR
jgi:hypothetical protein